jgi:chromate transporter
LLAAAIAFAPSFAFVLAGGRSFASLRSNPYAREFLNGAGPAAVGAILGSAIPLGLALAESWRGRLPRGRGRRAPRAPPGRVVVTLLALGVAGAVLAATHAVSVV